MEAGDYPSFPCPMCQGTKVLISCAECSVEITKLKARIRELEEHLDIARCIFRNFAKNTKTYETNTYEQLQFWAEMVHKISNTAEQVISRLTANPVESAERDRAQSRIIELIKKFKTRLSEMRERICNDPGINQYEQGYAQGRYDSFNGALNLLMEGQ